MDGMDFEAYRGLVGKYGIRGEQQKMPMGQLSDGQKSRIVMAYVAMKKPHLLMFDEPTNHLDMESIDALAEAINAFEGGLVLISHDFRLVSQVAKEIWVVDQKDKLIKTWKGNIFSYKAALLKEMQARK